MENITAKEEKKEVKTTTSLEDLEKEYFRE